MTYADFAKELVTGGIITDPWIDGEPRFRAEPLAITAPVLATLNQCAEDVAAVYHEVTLHVADDPSLLSEFFGLTPAQTTMWLASQPSWHGIARADVFLTSEGPCIAELNCDTPTGEAEAVILGRAHGDADPNRRLRERFLAMVDRVAAAELANPPAEKTYAIVYPTELTEDLSLVRLYRSWVEGRGERVVLGSPYNLAFEDGRLRLFGEPVDVVLRHYKTDWWGERSAVWTNDVITDAAPLAEPLGAIFEALAEGAACVVNPFGAVLPQNKRAMAYMWEQIHRFSPRAQSVIEKHVPYTARMETLHDAQLVAQKDEWVLKSDYGAEGDEVVIGRATNDRDWKRALATAKRKRFIGQRFFHAITGAKGETTNYGVFLVGGEASGLYVREQVGATDTHALSVGVRVK
ncbi:glutathionylspermidine synthase family protein [soil metagenome]